MDLDIAEVDISEIAGNLRMIFTEIANERSIDFRINYPKGISPILYIQTASDWRQILRNFLSNAFKFTGEHGKVTLEMESTPTGEAVFSVTDTGIGIPESKQAMIFEAFQTSRRFDKKEIRRHRPGLSISRELAQALGGGIRLQSEEGKAAGSPFTFPWTPLPPPNTRKPSCSARRKKHRPGKFHRIEETTRRGGQPGTKQCDPRTDR